MHMRRLRRLRRTDPLFRAARLQGIWGHCRVQRQLNLFTGVPCHAHRGNTAWEMCSGWIVELGQIISILVGRDWMQPVVRYDLFPKIF